MWHSDCIILSIHDGCNVESDCKAGGGCGPMYGFCHGGKDGCVEQGAFQLGAVWLGRGFEGEPRLCSLCRPNMYSACKS